MPTLSQNVNKKTASALLLAGSIFALAIGGTAYTIAQLSKAKAWVDHTQQVTTACQELLLYCLDVETGQRGYIATGNEKFLEPLESSRYKIESSVNQLMAFTADDQEEQRRMPELRAACLAKLAFVEKVLTLYKTDKSEAIRLTSTMQGKIIMDKVRNLVSQSQNHQKLLLERRQETVNLLQNWIGALIALFTVLEACSLVYIYKLTREYTLAQRKRTEELEAEIKLRKATELSLRETTVFLERSNQDLQQFAYVASHDLQEPLRAIQGFTTLIAKTYKGNLDEKADLWVEQVVSGVERMRTLINGLLQYARVESRGAEMREVDLNEVVKQVVSDLALPIEETGATIKIEQILPNIRGDAEQLRLLFTNLIGNSIKYRSKRPPEIEISVLRIDPNWQICIEDNGIGFDMQHQEKIFVIFQRLHSRSQYEGTGIGLALCRRIVERHRGTITALSTVDVGSKFLVKIPTAESYTHANEAIVEERS